MPIRRLLAALFLMLVPASAEAGAWPRPEGEGFASASARLSWPQDLADWTSREPTGQYYTLYAEYGLTDRITLGLDLGRSVSGSGKSIVFLRHPLRYRDRGLQIAAELGLGQIDSAPVLRPGLSLGVGRRGGWLAADGLMEYSATSGEADYKLDLTWGLKFDSGRLLILQVQTGVPQDEAPFARLAPSLVFPLRAPLKLELGGTWGVSGDESMGVMFGIWTEF